MKSNQPLLDERYSNLQVLDIDLDTIQITLNPIRDITLSPIDVNLQTLPVNLNPLFEGLTLTSFEDIGGLA